MAFDEEVVAQVMSLTGVSRSDAEGCLELGGGEADVAVSIFFDEADRDLGAEADMSEVLLYDTHQAIEVITKHNSISFLSCKLLELPSNLRMCWHLCMVN